MVFLKQDILLNKKIWDRAMGEGFLRRIARSNPSIGLSAAA